jgi:branched-chain amino acid aminotransferase
MAFPGTGKIWMNGSLVEWADAKIHVASHVVHYGSGVFEGARCYDTPRGSACFRLDTHLNRLFDSAKIYRMEMSLSYDEVHKAVIDTIKGEQATRPATSARSSTAAITRSASTRCPAPSTRRSSCGTGARISARRADQRRRRPHELVDALRAEHVPDPREDLGELRELGADQDGGDGRGLRRGIALDTAGFLSEGSGQNLFIVRNNVIYTPPATASILPGITRDSIITLAKDHGFTVREEMLPRELLYIADEAFFVGTAVEVTPIRRSTRSRSATAAAARSPRRSSRRSSTSSTAWSPTSTAGSSSSTTASRAKPSAPRPRPAPRAN